MDFEDFQIASVLKQTILSIWIKIDVSDASAFREPCVRCVL